MKSVDLNCDLGEGAGHDTELMPLISSANIACGAHAGNEATMRETVALALKHRVKIGAHPGFADRENFGRRELKLADEVLRELIVQQIATLRAFTELHHVKLHGALYNLAARDANVAAVAAAAIESVDRGLVVYALAGSQLVYAAQARGLVVAQEVFADRRYRKDGSLVSRDEAGALIANASDALRQVVRMVSEGVVRSIDGVDVAIRADTVCLHGDGPYAVEFAKALRVAFPAEDRG
jgi:UPF0271 protein